VTDMRSPRLAKVLNESKVLELAEKGDRSVLPQIRELLDKLPDAVDDLGDLHRVARNALLDLSSGEHVLLREAQTRKLDQMGAAISGPDPSALERLLANQIVLCWQQLRLITIREAQEREYSLTKGDYYQRCLDRAQRRYLQAIKTLAQVRRLGVPALQVNIAADGGKQVNVKS